MLWPGALSDDLDMTPAQRAEHDRHRAIHYQRVIRDGAIYAQPFSEGSAAAAGTGSVRHHPRRAVGGGWSIKRQEDLRLAVRRGALLRRALHRGQARNCRCGTRLYMAVPGNAPGLSIAGDWDPPRHAGNGVAPPLLFKDVFIPDEAQMMPRGIYFQGRQSLAPHVHHAVAYVPGDRHRGVRVHRALPCAARSRACRL